MQDERAVFLYCQAMWRWMRRTCCGHGVAASESARKGPAQPAFCISYPQPLAVGALLRLLPWRILRLP